MSKSKAFLDNAIVNKKYEQSKQQIFDFVENFRFVEQSATEWAVIGYFFGVHGNDRPSKAPDFLKQLDSKPILQSAFATGFHLACNCVDTYRGLITSSWLPFTLDELLQIEGSGDYFTFLDAQRPSTEFFEATQSVITFVESCGIDSVAVVHQPQNLRGFISNTYQNHKYPFLINVYNIRTNQQPVTMLKAFYVFEPSVAVLKTKQSKVAVHYTMQRFGLSLADQLGFSVNKKDWAQVVQFCQKFFCSEYHRPALAMLARVGGDCLLVAQGCFMVATGQSTEYLFDNTVFQQILGQNQARTEQMVDVASDVVVEHPAYLAKILNEAVLELSVFKMIDAMMIKQNEETIMLLAQKHFDTTTEQILKHGLSKICLGIDFTLQYFGVMKKLNKIREFEGKYLTHLMSQVKEFPKSPQFAELAPPFCKLLAVMIDIFDYDLFAFIDENDDDVALQMIEFMSKKIMEHAYAKNRVTRLYKSISSLSDFCIVFSDLRRNYEQFVIGLYSESLEQVQESQKYNKLLSIFVQQYCLNTKPLFNVIMNEQQEEEKRIDVFKKECSKLCLDNIMDVTIFNGKLVLPNLIKYDLLLDFIQHKQVRKLFDQLLCYAPFVCDIVKLNVQLPAQLQFMKILLTQSPLNSQQLQELDACEPIIDLVTTDICLNKIPSINLLLSLEFRGFELLFTGEISIQNNNLSLKIEQSLIIFTYKQQLTEVIDASLVLKDSLNFLQVVISDNGLSISLNGSTFIYSLELLILQFDMRLNFKGVGTVHKIFLINQPTLTYTNAHFPPVVNKFVTQNVQTNNAFIRQMFPNAIVGNLSTLQLLNQIFRSGMQFAKKFVASEQENIEPFNKRFINITNNLIIQYDMTDPQTIKQNRVRYKSEIISFKLKRLCAGSLLNDVVEVNSTELLYFDIAYSFNNDNLATILTKCSNIWVIRKILTLIQFENLTSEQISEISDNLKIKNQTLYEQFLLLIQTLTGRQLVSSVPLNDLNSFWLTVNEAVNGQTDLTQLQRCVQQLLKNRTARNDFESLAKQISQQDIQIIIQHVSNNIDSLCQDQRWFANLVLCLNGLTLSVFKDKVEDDVVNTLVRLSEYITDKILFLYNLYLVFTSFDPPVEEVPQIFLFEKQCLVSGSQPIIWRQMKHLKCDDSSYKNFIRWVSISIPTHQFESDIQKFVSGGECRNLPSFIVLKLVDTAAESRVAFCIIKHWIQQLKMQPTLLEDAVHYFQLGSPYFFQVFLNNYSLSIIGCSSEDTSLDDQECEVPYSLLDILVDHVIDTIYLRQIPLVTYGFVMRMIARQMKLKHCGDQIAQILVRLLTVITFVGPRSLFALELLRLDHEHKCLQSYFLIRETEFPVQVAVDLPLSGQLQPRNKNANVGQLTAILVIAASNSITVIDDIFKSIVLGLNEVEAAEMAAYLAKLRTIVDMKQLGRGDTEAISGAVGGYKKILSKELQRMREKEAAARGFWK